MNNYSNQNSNDLTNLNYNNLINQSSINNSNQNIPIDINNSLQNFNYGSKPISLDTLSLDILGDNNLDGTNLNDLGLPKSFNKGMDDNNSLIKSLTKEILNNLKDSNFNLADNLTTKSKDNTDTCTDDYIDVNYKKTNP